MSKFLLNLLLQITKALVYSKIKLLFRKEFFLTFGPINPAASQPIRPFGPTMAHFFSFQPAVFPRLPTGPQPLGWPSSPSQPSRLRVGGALPDCRLPHRKTPHLAPPCPSPCLADRWAPPVITFLRRCPSSTLRRRLVEPPWLSRPPPRPSMADRYHSLILAIITSTASNSSPPFNFHRRPLSRSPPRRTSSGLINWPPRPRRSLHLPHLTLPPLLKHECRCCQALPPPPFPRRRPVTTPMPEPW
jgi:hypothetical protein